MIEPLVERRLHAILSDKKRLATWCQDAGLATKLADILISAEKLSTQYSELEGHIEKQNVLRTVFASITLRTDAMILDIASGRLIAMLPDGTADQKGPAQPHGAANGTVTTPSRSPSNGAVSKRRSFWKAARSPLRKRIRC